MVSRAGWWTALCPCDDTFAWAICEGPGIADCPLVRVLVGVETHLLTLAPSTPRMLAMASGGGRFGLVGQAQDGGLVYFDGIVWDHYLQCASHPAVWWSGSQFVFYAPLNDGTHYVKIAGGTVSTPIPNEIGLTSGGIAYVNDDGTPVWAQTVRTRTVRGTTLSVTCERHGLVVGQLEGFVGGIAIDAGDPFVALAAPGMEPQLAFSGGTWACASWTQAGQACYNELPPFPAVPPAPPLVIPTFAFTHPVVVIPFKDPAGDTPAPMEVVVNQTGQIANRPYIASADSLLDRPGLEGIYTEAGDVSVDMNVARDLHTRLVVCHDHPTPFPIPGGLHPYDQLWLECYPVVGEAIDTSRVRWQSNLDDLLTRWSGDIGIVPAFYCQGGAPPHETWEVSDMLNCLHSLSALVNTSPRVKVIAPFAYQRANGIIAHPELRAALMNLLNAARDAGLAPFVPVETPAPIPTPIPTPTPAPPTEEPPMASQLAFCLTPLHSFSEPLVFDQVVNVESHPDGDGLSALKFPDGYASWSGVGWDVHKNSAGQWERFKLNGATMTAYREGFGLPTSVNVFACQPIVVKD